MVCAIGSTNTCTIMSYPSEGCGANVLFIMLSVVLSYPLEGGGASVSLIMLSVVLK